jgi:hypothetical protein
MSPQDVYVVGTEVFREDCVKYEFPDGEIDVVKTALILDPRRGQSIKFVAADEFKVKCAELRVLPWAYSCSSKLTKAQILYVYVKDTWPIYLLRLEADDEHGFIGPFHDPGRWPRWAELLGELAEITARLWA